jgi:hypothetical protein
VLGGAASSLPRRLPDAALFAGGLALAVAVHVVDPSEASIALCPFRVVTGLACPGCGTLRCLHALLHGDVAEAVDRNALTVVVLPLLVAAWVVAGLRAFTGRPLRSPVVPAWAIRTLAVGTVAFWAFRNVPAAPFSWLAPGLGS